MVVYLIELLGIFRVNWTILDIYNQRLIVAWYCASSGDAWHSDRWRLDVAMQSRVSVSIQMEQEMFIIRDTIS